MNRDDILKLYDRLIAVVEKLPGGIQKPILAELQPIREVFLEQRPARILLLGGGHSITAPALLHRMATVAVETGSASVGWRTYRIPDRGAVEILDARAGVPDAIVDSALASKLPDVALILCDLGESADALDLSAASARLAGAAQRGGTSIPLIGLIPDAGAERSLNGFGSLLAEEAGLVPTAIFPISGDTFRPVAESVCEVLPNPAKLEFARFAMARAAQVQIAERLLKSFSALCGVIGVQPIPLADLPILTTLQSLMVSLIVYVSGRTVSPRLVAEFGAAVGINVGAGFVFREAARAVVKVVPVWGNAVSGIVAGAGTYALGRAAIAYFIEERVNLNALKKTKGKLPELESGKK